MSEYHIFDTRLAKRYGILESVILCHFRFWIEKNKANDRHFHDGRYWTYTTVAALAQILDYASPKQLRRALDHLIAEGVLLTGNYNNSAYDRTLWYAFSDLENTFCPNKEAHLPEWANQNAQMGKPIPDINTDERNTDKRTDKENLKRESNTQLEQDFEAIWDAYPNKQGKANALKDYIKARRKGVTDDEILIGIENYKRWIKANHKEQYIKNGSTWFHQECWNDDYTIHYTDIRDVPIDMTETLEEWARGL